MKQEVWIETFKKNWIWVTIVTVLIFIFIPMNIMVTKDSVAEKQAYISQLGTQLEDNYITNLANNYTQNVVETQIFTNWNYAILLIFPVLISIVVFQRIKDKKEKLDKSYFLTLLFSEIVLLILPYLVNFIILCLLKLMGGYLDTVPYVSFMYWAGVSIIISILVVAITNMVALITKNKITQGLMTYTILFLPIILLIIVEKLLTKTLFGFPGFSDSMMNCLQEYPVTKILSVFVYNSQAESYLTQFNLWHGILYLAISGIFTTITYHWRNTENTTISKIIIQYSLSFTFMALSYLIAVGIWGIGIGAVIVSLIISLLVYILIEIIAQKTFAIWDKLKGLAIYAILAVVFYVLSMSNLGGYETKIPEADEVEYAIYSVNSPSETNKNIYYKEKNNIQFIIDKQKELLEAKKQVKDYETKTYDEFYIQYKLKNGKVITRAYETEPLYLDIYDTAEFINQRYAYVLQEQEQNNISRMSIIGIKDSQIFDIELTRKDTEQELKDAIQAIKTDIIENKVYKNEENAYNKFGDKEGIQYLTIDIYSDQYISKDYVSYVNFNEQTELVKLVQKWIEEDKNFINWED